MDISSIGVPSMKTQFHAMPNAPKTPPKMSPKLVAERLVALRQATGLGPSEFADTVEIDRSSYSKIEAAKKPLKADMAFAISERWGFPMDFIYKGELQGLPERYSAQVIRNLTAQ